jgi:hypothetical protein
VSARTLSVRNSLPIAALANNASLSPSTAASPQRLVIFINVVGCGTRIPSRDAAKPLPGNRIGHLPT